MGRKDGVAVIIEINARMRQIEPRLQITYGPNWQALGNGMVEDYLGGLVHHTAFLSSLANPFPAEPTLRNGRPDLKGPLCNYGGPACTIESPRIHVVAAHPSNNAGASGGRSMGPLPITSLFNKYVLGLEIDYAGLTPMLPGQLYVAYIWARAVADVLAGGNIEFIRAHAETSITGKWDIGSGAGAGRTYDMADFRRRAAAVATAIPTTSIQETDVRIAVTPDKTCWIIREMSVAATGSINEVSSLAKGYGIPVLPMTREEVQECINSAARYEAGHFTRMTKLFPTPVPVDYERLADELAERMSAVTVSPFTDEMIEQLIDDVAIETTALMASRLGAGSVAAA